MKFEKKLALPVIVACAACCAVPLAALVPGVLGLSTAGVFIGADNLRELAACLAPIAAAALAYAVYALVRARQHSRTARACSCTTECGTVK